MGQAVIVALMVDVQHFRAGKAQIRPRIARLVTMMEVHQVSLLVEQTVKAGNLVATTAGEEIAAA